MSDAWLTLFLPSYNGGDPLRECVESVLAQTRPDWELVILDDGSEDGSREWLERLRDPRVTVRPAPAHLGIEANWARAMMHRARPFVTFLGQDDRLDPHFLEVIRELVREHPGASLFHAHFRFIDRDGRLLHPCEPIPPRETADEWLRALLARQRRLHATGYVMRAADLRGLGGIPPYPGLLFADYELWLRLTLRAYKAAAAEECFSCRLHPGSVSGSAGSQLYIPALARFFRFLREFLEEDPRLAEAFRGAGPGFCLEHSRYAYRLALKEANRENQAIDPEVLERVTAALAELAPELVPQLREDRDLRRRERVNRGAARRLAHALVARLRDRIPQGGRR